MTDDRSLATLRAAAFAAMERAYAPYSHFRVGAALETADGAAFVGCNVENAAYPAGICAERGAVAAAVAHGARSFTRLVIATDASEPASPCGICRQVLAELAPDAAIISCTMRGAETRWNVGALLPDPFTSHSLDHA